MVDDNFETSTRMKIPAQKKLIALIVDDDVQICRAIARRIFAVFDEVLTSTSPEVAQELLKHNAVTHLLSDFDFGYGCDSENATGYYYVARWRHQCPSIQRAVVFTGWDVSTIPRPKEVDAVVSKAEGVDVILDCFYGVRRYSR